VQDVRTIDPAGGLAAWAHKRVPDPRLSFRRATTSDRDFLLALFVECRPELELLPEAVRGQLVAMQLDSQLSQYRSAAPDAVDWILGLDQQGRVEPVGRCYLWTRLTEHRLMDLAVRRQWRGRGLGSRVLAGLCADAAQAGVPLRLTVWHDNRDALRLYERHGFVVESPGRDLAMTESAGYVPLRWSAGEAP
jgi:ribosomal protein S18 acetylase RimI-like enzyme